MLSDHGTYCSSCEFESFVELCAMNQLLHTIKQSSNFGEESRGVSNTHALPR